VAAGHNSTAGAIQTKFGVTVFGVNMTNCASFRSFRSFRVGLAKTRKLSNSIVNLTAHTTGLRQCAGSDLIALGINV
jgi:hypothetical protein